MIGIISFLFIQFNKGINNASTIFKNIQWQYAMELNTVEPYSLYTNASP